MEGAGGSVSTPWSFLIQPFFRGRKLSRFLGNGLQLIKALKRSVCKEEAGRNGRDRRELKVRVLIPTF